MKTPALLCTLSFLVIGCGTTKMSAPAKIQEPAPITEEATVDENAETGGAPVAEQEGVKKTEAYVIASLRRAPCYGQCPSFAITFYSDGKAVYEGKAHVDRIGTYQAQLDPGAIVRIQQRAEAAGFFELEEAYPERKQQIPDLPNTITFVKKGQKEKTIVNNHNAPVELLAFERFLEEEADRVLWERKD